MFDLVLKNGQIFDGSGAEGYTGDIAVKDGKIAAIGKMDTDADSSEVIDVSGLAVSPGFVDMHTHSDFTLIADGDGCRHKPFGEQRCCGLKCDGDRFIQVEFRQHGGAVGQSHPFYMLPLNMVGVTGGFCQMGHMVEITAPCGRCIRFLQRYHIRVVFVDNQGGGIQVCLDLFLIL